MWEAISKILTSNSGWQTLLSLLILVLIVSVMIKTGMLKIRTKHVNIGMSESDRERTIVREQINWTHKYLEGLQGKIRAMTPEMLYGGFFTKYILEIIFDEIVNWITFNHIEDTERYISIKQKIISSLIYAQNIQSQFKTREFKERVDRWVEEVIKELINIRKLYS